MLGIDLLTAGALLTLVGNTIEIKCDMAPTTKINVIPTTEPIKYDMSRSVTQIQGGKSGTVNPHSFGGVSVTQGFMEGSISMRPTVKMGYATYKKLNLGCVWYEQIDIKMNITPRIVIGKEVAADKCMKPAVLEHELKHVKVDRQVVNKYSAIMGKKVHDEIAKRGFVAGPIPVEQMQSTVARMQETVGQIVELEYRKMDIERTELQRGVDSLEEYNRVQATCPDFNPLAKTRQR